MRLKLIEIEDRGVPGKECLRMAVQAAVNLNFYVVLDTTRIANGLISRFAAHYYWFQEQPVAPGDSVILHTGPGTNSCEKLADGGTAYSFYWGLSSTLWNEPSTCAVLMEVNEWQTSPIAMAASD